MAKVLKSNWVLLALYGAYYIALYFLFESAYTEILILHGVLMLVALSPLGEAIMRFLNNVREIKLKKEVDYLLPLFDEVYEEAKQVTPTISKNIKLYKNKQMSPNAFALGSNTIILTKGAVKLFSRAELKGLIAHELGHIVHGDTKILMMIVITNAVAWFVATVFKFFYVVSAFLARIIVGEHIAFAIVDFIKFLVLALLNIFISLVVSFSMRTGEYLADEYASELGYGEELASALTKINELEVDEKLTLLQRLQASHPDLEKRIIRLQ